MHKEHMRILTLHTGTHKPVHKCKITVCAWTCYTFHQAAKEAVVPRGALWKPTSVICFSPFPPMILTLVLTPCATLKGILQMAQVRIRDSGFWLPRSRLLLVDGPLLLCLHLQALCLSPVRGGTGLQGAHEDTFPHLVLAPLAGLFPRQSLTPLGWGALRGQGLSLYTSCLCHPCVSSRQAPMSSQGVSPCLGWD